MIVLRDLSKSFDGGATFALRDLDPGLMYKALAQDEVDLSCAFSTDGRIQHTASSPWRMTEGFSLPTTLLL